MKTISFTFLLLLMSIGPASAMNVSYIKVACNPSAGTFKFEHYWSEDEPEGVKSGKQRISQAKADSGYFDPHNLRYTCALDNKKYTLIAEQEPMRERGYCGGAPEVIVSLQRGQKRLISEAVLGYSCWGNPTIDSVEIKEVTKLNPQLIITACSAVEEGKAMKCKNVEP
jgi:hypothetical protein